ncbi:hypothetical protein E3U32_04055 [Lelliottia nimipressuralis]|uniref:hypothetical protein n=1 Tax=Lelliottia nimipressuralis TaxID=69220 RepID=UPI00106B7E73|nr:hypothetical protein [Lelliottia nimipressuralis]TFB27243.1 hypothetical protein E3U32_04055 [Lelliottia nimipressuralis]
MIKNLARIDQLSVRFIKWGKTIIYKGDYLPEIDPYRFLIDCSASGNCFDIMMLNNSYQNDDSGTKTSAFTPSRLPVFVRTLFFSFPSRQHDFFQVIF